MLSQYIDSLLLWLIIADILAVGVVVVLAMWEIYKKHVEKQVEEEWEEWLKDWPDEEMP
jgi:hypothetical protein